MSVLTTAASPPRPAVAPRAAAKAWIFAFLVANVVLATVFFALGGLSDDPLISAGRLAGLYAAQAVAGQLLLVARLPWLERRLGMDRLTSWHRWTGFTLLWLLVAHVVLVVVGYPGIERTNPANELVHLADTFEGILRAIVAFVLILVVGAASTRFARRRMAYETWHFVHLYTYAAVVLAFTHQIAVGQSFASHPAARVYCWTLWLGTGLAVLCGRVLPAAASQPAAPLAGGGRRAGVAGHCVGVHDRPRPRPAAGPSGPVLPVALPHARPLVAGQPVVAVSRARGPHAAAHGQGRRQLQREPAVAARRHARVRRRPVRRLHHDPPATARRAADRR
nr:ferric reductase-like transmembrane domain-containing protein [Amycolatopsis sp. FDAARGOS 1241]